MFLSVSYITQIDIMYLAEIGWEITEILVLLVLKIKKIKEKYFNIKMDM